MSWMMGRDRLPDAVHETVEFSILASQIDPFDPMEKAFKKLGEDYLAKTEHIHLDWELVKEYPLSKELLAMSRVWRSPSGKEYVIAAKGAPEAIVQLCHCDSGEVDQIFKQVQTMAQEGMRVLGVASASFQKADLPEGQHDFEFEFQGLIGMEDPVRPGVPAGYQRMLLCRNSGNNDHRRPSRYRPGYRQTDRSSLGPGHHRARAAKTER